MDEIDRLIEQLKSPDPKEREKAAQDLHDLAREAHSQLGIAKAIPALAEVLKDDNFSIASQACCALGEIGTRAIPYLIRVLKEGDPIGREHAAYAIHHMGEYFKKQGKLKEVLGKAEALQMIQPLIEELRKYNDNNIYPLSAALYWIAAANPGNPGVNEMVLPLIKTMERNFATGYVAIRALGAIGSPKAVLPLIGMLDNKENEIRYDSYQALEQIIQKRDSLKALFIVEKKLVKGFSILLEKHGDSNEAAYFHMQFAQLRNSIAKRRDELSRNKDVLLDDKPRPPKREGKIYQQIRRTVRDG